MPLSDTRTLLVNADILTMDRSRPKADALLIDGERIVRTGTAAELRAVSGGAAEIDLGGRFLCPGFVDAHNHFSLTALEPVSIDCRPAVVRSLDALLERVRLAASAAAAGTWLRGHGYDEVVLGGHPTRDDLDRAAPAHPLVLVHWSVHRCTANSAALRAVGLDTAGDDPPGGWLIRRADGLPAGPAYERASDPLQAASIERAALDLAGELPALFRANARTQHAVGITALGDAYVHPALAPVYAATELGLSVRPFCGSTDGLFAPPWGCLDAPEGVQREGLLGRGLKIFADGGGNTTAASLRSGRPPRFLFYQPDELNRLVAQAHGQAMPVAIHAAGDIAVTMALDAIAEAQRVHPDVEPRFRIEHAITINERDIHRFAPLGVVLVGQPSAYFESGARLRQAPLAEGVRVAPVRDLLDAGVTVACSSDSPCYALPPLWQMWCAASRATAEAGEAGDDGQAVTPEEALRAYTASGAAALFDPDGGVLRAGARADLVVLSADPRATPLEGWRQIAVEQVWVRGVRIDLHGAPPLPGRALAGW